MKPDTPTSNVDPSPETDEKAPAVARACARRAGPLGQEVAEDGSDGAISIGEVERIAVAIEAGTPRPGEKLHDILAEHPRVRRAILAAAVRALGAKKWWWDSKRKRRIEEPDYALSFRAAEFLADRADGRPAQAVLNLNVAASPQAAQEAESLTPASIEALERLLAKTNGRGSAVQKRLEAVPAENLPAGT